MYFLKMELTGNEPTFKNKSYLKHLHPLFGEAVILMSMCSLIQVFLWRASLCFKKTPSSPTEIVAYLFYLCFCFGPTHGEPTNPVMWLCSIVLIAVMEAGCWG